MSAGLFVCFLGHSKEEMNWENDTESPGQNLRRAWLFQDLYDHCEEFSLGLGQEVGFESWLSILNTCSPCAVESVNHWVLCLLRPGPLPFRAEWVSCLLESVARQPGSELLLKASGRTEKIFSIFCSRFQTYMQRLIRLQGQTAHILCLLVLTFGASYFQGTSRSK